MEKLTKRKNASSKGNALLKPKRRNEEQEVAYILTDVKKLSSQRFSTNLFL